ncbi:RNA-directed DNA polymerase, eukaryota, Reverse transcriptase zinc-binding domain protein [Artemisia annua]|uniref:RNA-directed DNA polymerase, eukaryota, Reverse transcriptase zinc-binding domain protein n=1 Tax=Artemisia annua TaxID=35608 RepID=A0A2U1LEW0_ARTAN|nr:RNA-directed DNA polymerase, eukaryota, Reverse transcriptase zinc-binding domain protein [Artemisia annua]
MKSGIYPSLAVRTDWSLAQLDYVFQNCSKYGMEPYIDEEDVESENEGMATSMKPEKVETCGPAFAWNVRGLGNEVSQKQVIDLLREGGFSFCGLLETRVKKKNLSKICSKVLGNWDWISNASMCEGGSRIVIGWDPNAVRVMLHSQTSQLMNVFVEAVNGSKKFFCSFIYSHVKSSGRRELWKDLIIHSQVVKNAPWALLGDFNIILEACERSMGSSVVTAGMVDFRECLYKIEVMDLIMSGLQFTWNKSPGNPSGLLKKLDRVMNNVHFMDKFRGANALFLPFVASDHTPMVLNIPSIAGAKPKPFKFANFLSSKPEFLSTVESVWCKEIPGYSMFSVASKLKLLKKPLRKLKYSQGDLAAKVHCDNHDHLFFGCKFASQVWSFFKDFMRLDNVPDNIYQVLDFMIGRPMNKSIWSIIHRLVIGAVVYVIWQERNVRIFQGFKDWLS